MLVESSFILLLSLARYNMHALNMYHHLAILEDEERERRRALRVERVLIRHRGIYRIADAEFKVNFRISKHTFERILLELTPHLAAMRRTDGISIETKVS